MIEKRIVIIFFDVTLFIIIYIVLALVFRDVNIKKCINIYHECLYLIAKDF